MAHGLKCYCCGKSETSDAHYYCRDCLVKLKTMFKTSRAIFDGEEYEILENPHHSHHCVSCGQHENRRIIDRMLICDKCVESELWEQADNGLTINTVGSENGIIVKDEESVLGARITLERDGATSPYAITCGIYGLFVHTAFWGNLTEANTKYDEMKKEMQAFLLAEALNEADISDWCRDFANRY